MATFSMGGRYARTYGGGMLASCSSAVASVVRGVPQPAAVLGVAAPALYLRTRDAVIAVLTSDAVRLPCAVLLSMSRAEFSLRDVPPDGFVAIGDGALRWISGGHAVTVDVVREWRPPRVRPVVPRVDRIAELRWRTAVVDIGVPAEAPSLAALLGRGPGLTPSGDDVLAGYVLGCRAFGLPVPSLDGLHRTTALSAALLEYASAGVAVPEVAAVIAGLGAARSSASALDALLRIGHTSGAALGTGVLLAASAMAVRAA